MRVVADARRLPFKDASVDLVLTSAPTDLDHTDRVMAYSEISRVAKYRVVICANTPGQRPVAGRCYPAWSEKFVRTQIGLNSNIGDVVLDPFCGVGVTMDVAACMGRTGIGSDLHG